MTDIQKLEACFDYLDEMNSNGRIEYSDYLVMHDLIGDMADGVYIEIYPTPDGKWQLDTKA